MRHRRASAKCWETVAVAAVPTAESKKDIVEWCTRAPGDIQALFSHRLPSSSILSPCWLILCGRNVHRMHQTPFISSHASCSARFSVGAVILLFQTFGFVKLHRTYEGWPGALTMTVSAAAGESGASWEGLSGRGDILVDSIVT